jgi:S-adenosylmethionine-diacylgycerolhomoserine-N-methlytransferase
MSVASSTDLMNRTYRHQRHFYDFTRKYYLLGRDRLIAELAPADGDAVLEIGCGTARNLAAAAARYPRARLFGIDVSTEMLTSAVATIARAGLSSQIRVAHADATRFDPQPLFGVGRFERVFISYSLSMIPDWQAVIDGAISVLAPGGKLHIVDFGGQGRLPGLFRTLLRRWLGWFHVTPRDELEKALRGRAQAARASLFFERPYRDYAQYAVLRLPPS